MNLKHWINSWSRSQQAFLLIAILVMSFMVISLAVQLDRAVDEAWHWKKLYDEQLKTNKTNKTYENNNDYPSTSVAIAVEHHSRA